MSTVELGTVVAGRYVLERPMSEGGIGSLWRARDQHVGRTCALRLGDGAGLSATEVLQRFRAEAEVVAAIRCDNVLDIYEHGEWNGLPFLVTEHVEGEDLSALLRREGRLQPGFAYPILVQIARALVSAHNANVVHGDLKPEHVLLARAGDGVTARVFNFNLTQRARDVGVADATRLGAFLSLPYYASPEQIGRKPVDGRSDLWSLGVIAYECLTGKRPFDSSVFGDLVALIAYDPMPKLELPGLANDALDAWWKQACARAATERFESATAMLDALGHVLNLRAPDLGLVRPNAQEAPLARAVAAPPATPSGSPVGGTLRKVARHGTQIGLGVVPIANGSGPGIAPALALPAGFGAAPGSALPATRVSRHGTQIGLGLSPVPKPKASLPVPASDDAVAKALRASMPSSPGDDLLGKGLWTSVAVRPDEAELVSASAPAPRSIEPQATPQIKPASARGFEVDLLSEVEWPELPAEPRKQSHAPLATPNPQMAEPAPGSSGGGSAQAVAAEVAVTAVRAEASQAVVERAATNARGVGIAAGFGAPTPDGLGPWQGFAEPEEPAGAASPAEAPAESDAEASPASERVLEASVAGSGDEELPEVDADEGELDREATPDDTSEGVAESFVASERPAARPAGVFATQPASGLPPVLRNKVLWIVAAFLAGVVLMTLHILLPRPAADLQSGRPAPQKSPTANASP